MSDDFSDADLAENYRSNGYGGYSYIVGDPATDADYARAPGGAPGNDKPWYADVLKGAGDAAKYLLTGAVAKISNDKKLPNSPKAVQSDLKKWLLYLAILGVGATVVVIAVKRSRR